MKSVGSSLLDEVEPIANTRIVWFVHRFCDARLSLAPCLVFLVHSSITVLINGTPRRGYPLSDLWFSFLIEWPHVCERARALFSNWPACLAASYLLVWSSPFWKIFAAQAPTASLPRVVPQFCFAISVTYSGLNWWQIRLRPTRRSYYLLLSTFKSQLCTIIIK
jgi:hypothetical protein